VNPADKLVAVAPNGAALNWQTDFAQIYAIREHCPLAQAARAAAILCDSLSQLSPMHAVVTVLDDRDLLAALRIATRESPKDSPPGELKVIGFAPLAPRSRSAR
jgi:hypothetical protein